TAGGLAPIGDVPKTEVYELAAYINRGGEVIPRGTIEQPPSAELKPGQTDQDDLPPYAVLDKILGLYLDERLDPVEIAEEGLDEELVAEVIARVKWAGFKRRQSPPALQVFSKGNVWPDLPLVSNLGETEEQA
ncbi:MAG: NAD(+) synthase, partial [Planctomycetota bacterium]